MRILMLGAGVIGTLYGWALATAGHEVRLIVKPSHRSRFDGRPIRISVLDTRTDNLSVTTDVIPG
jgi:2-dehydropantoate 2-reductase